ncbi:MAG: enoyl-CoA hydratase/isomerase family protein [Propionibacteriaceae bacterium]|nr:enoyl-CoA hydratase/isomerase family protein [Propionibacteriaceae bacterium]
MITVVDGVGVIQLNRPRAINALSGAMIQRLTQVLTSWIDDDCVTQVLLGGVGRGLCAGADVRQLRQVIMEAGADPVEFLRREYALDQLIATYSKPFTAAMHGIVMGGGLGLSAHAARRVVTADAALAMPETIIGLWPDVGVTYRLARMPGEVGTYMALTGLTVTGRQAVELGLADDLDMRGLITGEPWSPSAMVELVRSAPAESLVAPGRAGGSDPAGPISLTTSDTLRSAASDDSQLDDTDLSWTQPFFSGDDAAAILARLESDNSDRTQKTAAAIRARSPLSVAVSLAAVRRAATMTLDEVFAQDLRLGAFFLNRPDFAEGVRAQLVDKDHHPHWSLARLEDVTPAQVEAAFED